MDKHLQDVIKPTLKNISAVKFSYLFGSHARGTPGPSSDVDIAVYVDNRFDFFPFVCAFWKNSAGNLRVSHVIS